MSPDPSDDKIFYERFGGLIEKVTQIYISTQNIERTLEDLKARVGALEAFKSGIQNDQQESRRMRKQLEQRMRIRWIEAGTMTSIIIFIATEMIKYIIL
jgi:hypothetical protein